MSVLRDGINRKTSKFFVARLFFVVGIFSASLFFVTPTFAATLSISPATGRFTTQNNFTVSVEVNTNQAINGVEAVLNFPTNKLEVVGVSKSHSIMSLWVQEPSFSNGGQIGVVQFSAIKLNPGYTGSKGNVVDILFRVKDTGVANITLASGAILANDGKGTNLLNAFGGAVFSLVKGVASTNPTNTPVPASPTRVQSLEIPQLKYWVQDAAGKDVLWNTSDADPKWSNSPYAKMTWTLPADAVGAVSVLDDNPDTEPQTKTNDMTADNSKVLPFLTEGKHYFHIRFYNSAGAGPVLHFPLFIDLNEPKHFTIDFSDAETDSHGIHSTSNPRPRAVFFTEDAMSGLDHYAYSINNSDWSIVTLERDGTFILPKLPAEIRQDLIVRAYDLAGNFADAAASVVVEPIVAPAITFYPHNIDMSAGALVIDGRAAPGARVDVVMEHGNSSPITDSIVTDENGFWRLIYTKMLPADLYWVRARQVLDNGAESSFTEPVSIRVNLWSGKIFQWLQDFNKYILLFILFAASELLTLFYYRRAVKRMQFRMDQQFGSAVQQKNNQI